MCNYYGLEFGHFVVATTEGTIFACARENGHTHNFLIRGDESVMEQTGDHWISLTADWAEVIRDRAQAAYARVPTYRIPRLEVY
jgi:hypothetical protein